MKLGNALQGLTARRARFARSGFAESTLAEMAWQRTRKAASRWSAGGVVAGLALGLLAFAPAGWLAQRVASATGERLLLTDARGTIWSGSAVLVLSGGPDSRDASALPGRLHWQLGLDGLTPALRLSQSCCLSGETTVRIHPGLGRLRLAFVPPPGHAAGTPYAHWPAAWLSGLGTPWNTLQLGGVLQFGSQDLTLHATQGRWQMQGRADVQLTGASSRISTLPTLGSYRLNLQGNGEAGTQIGLSTLQGPLRIDGSGQWAGGRVRFLGQAQAEPGSEAALNNLLNIIGRRRGASSLISIG